MMTHKEIKKALQEKDLTFAALATATGKKSSNLTACSSRASRSKPCAQIISAAIGKPISVVFSDVEAYLKPDTAVKNKDRVDMAKRILKDAGLENLVA